VQVVETDYVEDH